MGIFAGETFDADDFIGEYVGELIDEQENEIRGALYNDIGCSYMFNHTEEKVMGFCYWEGGLYLIREDIEYL